MKNDAIVIWRDVPVLYREKTPHVSAKKQKKRVTNSFGVFYGDVPIACHNDVTKQFMLVVNPRGNAYAARRRQQYRKHI